MLGGFWESVGGKLADRWASVAGRALAFWTGGLLAWIYAGPGLRRLDDIARWLDRQTAATQVAALLAGLLVVLASALVAQRLTTPMLRALEGYWPKWAARQRRLLVARARERARRDRMAFQELNALRRTVTAQLSAPDVAARDELEAELADLGKKLADVEMRAHRRPPGAELMPTPTGNILRAAETRPASKYGLDAVIVWPHLWLAMPDSSRQELVAARMALDGAAATVVWGLAFCVFTPLAWWALPAGLAVAAAAAAWWVPNRAEVFADLVDAVYDLHRSAVYQLLRWPLPSTPEEERAVGDLLTQYLWRGTPPPDGFHFTSA